MNEQGARDLAVQVLGWLADHPDRLAGFLSATGLDPRDLRAVGDDPTIDLALIDHLMGDEALLLAACADLDLSPETPARAQTALGGGPGPHWT